MLEDGSVACVSIDQGLVYRFDGASPPAPTRLGGGPNGATSDGRDAIYVAQNGGNWMRNPHPDLPEPGMSGGVQRIDPDGSVRWLTRELLAPNDICFGPDGLLYTTDPTRDRRYDDGRLWRIHPETGEAELLLRVPWFCNGIGFGLDGGLYVVESGGRTIVRFDVTGGGLRNQETVIQVPFPLAADGFAFDLNGDLVTGTVSRGAEPAELVVFTTDGAVVERVPVGPGHHYTNVALSGDGGLLVTDSEVGRLLCLDWPAGGLALYPRRHQTPAAPPLAAAFSAAPAVSP